MPTADVLITGVCGFVGSTLARALLEANPRLRIVGFDNLSRSGSETNVEPLRKLGVDVRIGNICDVHFLEQLPESRWILDCAANPSVLAGVQSAATSAARSQSRVLLEQNLYGTVNVLELCKKWTSGLILLSTSRVYSLKELCGLPLRVDGKRFILDVNSDLPRGITERGVREDFSVEPPVSLYGVTKLCSELIALEYSEAFGFPVWVNRCGVLAGAGQFGKADQGIFSYWIHAWKTARRLVFYGFGGRGYQVRDCLHPRDLLPVLLQQMERGCCDGKSRVCHFGGGIENSMSLTELTEWCEERLGKRELAPSPVEASKAGGLGGERPYDVPWLVLDWKLAENEWGWRPMCPLSSILEEIVEHSLQNPRWLELSEVRRP